MDPPTHIIDPDGEVIIVLRNSDSYFAEAGENMFVNGLSHTDDIQIPSEEIEPPEPIEQSYRAGSSIRRKKEKKKKGSWKNKSSSLSATAYPMPEAIQLPTEEPDPEPPTEYPVPEEPVPEEPVPEEPVPEEPVPEEPVPEEPVPEEPVPEEPVPKDPGLEEGVVEEHAEQTEEQAESDLEETCFRIQVSAKHLILASSVFKKILTGGWKESVTFLKERSVEITAEGWDIEALLILLRAIHGQQYHIPRRLTLEMLAKIAVLVDYYDCKEAVYIWTTIWIEALEEKIPVTYCRDLILWLWVSWAFQLRAQFEEATSTILSWSDGWINSLGLPIPAEVIEAMDKQRQENIGNLVGLFHGRHRELLTGIRGCCFECSSIMCGALTREMHKVDLLSPSPAAPFLGLSYRGLVQKILSLRDPRWSRISYSHDYHKCPDSRFTSIFGSLNEITQGLDLHDLLP